MEEDRNDSKESNERNKSKSFFDLYENISQRSNLFNGTNLYDRIDQNSSSSK